MCVFNSIVFEVTKKRLIRNDPHIFDTKFDYTKKSIEINHKKSIYDVVQKQLKNDSITFLILYLFIKIVNHKVEF